MVSNINTSIVDSYLILLKNLSTNNKLELIAKLSKSLKTPSKKKDNNLQSLFGAMELENSVDYFIEDLKKNRNFNRKSADLL